jgi:glycolate oxidase iron-sulfur subunit
VVRAAVVAGALVPPVRRRAGLPAGAWRRRSRLRSSGNDVVLVTGCVMDAAQRDVHVATARVLEAMGFGVALASGCCGALAAHAGLSSTARRSLDALARAVDRAAPSSAPVVVDAAGCGAQLKAPGPLAERTLDVHELVAAHLDRLPPLQRREDPIAVQDPCHLRHVQRTHLAVRAVLAEVAPLVELDDDGLCCGAGGAFAVQEPELAAGIRARKVEAIQRTGARTVASANPGCALHLAAAGVEVRHPMELLSEALPAPR